MTSCSNAAAVALLALTLACDSSQNAASPAPAPAPAAAPEAPAAAARATVPTEPAAPQPTPAPIVATVPRGADYLVWRFVAGAPSTQWVHTTDAAFEVIAERKAIVTTDGTRLWRVERQDQRVDVVGCDCGDADPSTCAKRGRIALPGLMAFELGSGTKVPVRMPEATTLMAEDSSQSVGLAGGVGPALLVAWGDGGFYCGAHGSYGGGSEVFDLRAASNRVDPYAGLGARLEPAERDAAANELLTTTKECDLETAPTPEEMRAQMRVSSVAVALVKRQPQLTWTLTSDLPYVCSPDYLATSQVFTGLSPAAVSLGLAGPLRPGLAAAMATMGDATAIGWGRLDLDGDARTRALEQVRGVPETPWPSAAANEIEPLPAPAGTPEPGGVG